MSASGRFSPYNVRNREQEFGRCPGPRGSGRRMQAKNRPHAIMPSVHKLLRKPKVTESKKTDPRICGSSTSGAADSFVRMLIPAT